MLASRRRAHVSPSRIFSEDCRRKRRSLHGALKQTSIRAHQAGYGFSGTISFLPSRPASCSAHRRLEYGYWCRVESAPRRRRLDAAGFLLAEVITNSAEVLNVRSRAAGHLRGDQIFSEDTRGSKFHHHDRSSPSVLRPRAEVGQVLASTVTSARLHLALRCQDRLHARRREPSGRRSISHRRDYDASDAQLGPNQRGTAEGRTTNTSPRQGETQASRRRDRRTFPCLRRAARDGLKPYLPESLRRQAFDTAHTLSHPSGRATVKRVALLYFWPSMSKDIVRWAKQCVPCQQSKVHRHNRAELGKFRHTGRPIRSCAHRHRQDASSPRISNCLTMIDRYTRWPQAIPIGDMSAQTVAKAFFHGWISFFWAHRSRSRPRLIRAHSSKGSSSLSYASSARPRHRGLSHFQASSSAYELPSKRTCKRRQRRWFSARSLRIPGEFVARQEPDKTSPSEFVLALRRLFQAIRPVPASRHVQHRPFVFKDLATSDYVFRRLDTILKPLEQPYTGPHRVIRRINERNFVVDVNGVAKTLSTDQLKPAYLDVADSGASQATPEQPTTTRSLHQHGESPFHSLRKLPSPLGGGVAVAPQSSPPNTRRSRRQLGASRPASPAAESAPVDLSHLRTAAKREKKKAVKSLRA
ncbi:unnamed protein product [Trichogramma brassicae]|uniref:Integrase zinc-binding domain-containing protein n=1 Tax=Trichogramma brassicae TaxID=86971 RepID=A0A6H5J2P7_9HYME|nr:unnamed protein product [Trichogramma brassicae]